MAHLAQWRLKLGAQILQSTKDSVAEAAEAVGYGSEAAFNRTFKREFDCRTAQFRRKRKPHWLHTRGARTAERDLPKTQNERAETNPSRSSDFGDSVGRRRSCDWQTLVRCSVQRLKPENLLEYRAEDAVTAVRIATVA
jgi:hypothetical protein